MFVTILIAAVLIALVVSFIIVRVFRKPVDLILVRILGEEIGQAWAKVIRFAIYVTGVSSGVRIWDIENSLSRPHPWIVEAYRTVICALRGSALLLLVFFAFTIIAFVVVRAFELRRSQ